MQFKTSISKGNYISPAIAMGQWPSRVTALKKEIGMYGPRFKVQDSPASRVIIRKADGTRYTRAI